MKHRMFILVIAILLTRCASIHYLGETYPPTQRVDLYFTEQDIAKEYKIIGRMEATADADELVYSSDKFTQAILKKAGEKGADAIVILDFKKVMTGVTEFRSRTETTEEKERGTVTREHEDVSHSIDEKRRVEALVIKYR